MHSSIRRRRFLTASGTAVAIALAGCLGEQPAGQGDQGDHTCNERWNVVLYNKSDTKRSATVTIQDSEDDVLFSGTVDLDPNTGRSSGIELDEEVRFEQSYNFEAELSDGNSVSMETVLKCGNVYIYVNESGKLEIQDDEVDHI